jgi:hypothetical protein
MSFQIQVISTFFTPSARQYFRIRMMRRVILAHFALAMIRVTIPASIHAGIICANVNADGAVAPFALIFIAGRVHSKKGGVNARYRLYT